MSENKIATKADLQRMYNKMLPYLGGMPEMVANKFSRGDLYSTDEKMIGQWIDGKPLYQKCYTGTMPTTASTWGTLIELSGAQFIDADIYVTREGDTNIAKIGNSLGNDGGTFYLQPSINKIAIYPVSWMVNRPYYAITKYTKTTDSPISIGSDTDYSTEEKIVGTWIDGKPLYQKTIYISSFPENTGSFVHNIANIEHVTDVSACMFVSNGGIRVFKGRAEINANNSSINITGSQGYSEYTGYSTIQYTKTTD